MAINDTDPSEHGPYTYTDFVALRAFLQRVPTATIARQAVNDPRAVRREASIRIDRALPETYGGARAFMDVACEPLGAKQWRIARALLLPMRTRG